MDSKIELSSDQENVNITQGIPREDEEGRYKWIFVNWEMESPDFLTEEEAKKKDFILKHYGEEFPLEYRRKDKQFLYFKARDDSSVN